MADNKQWKSLVLEDQIKEFRNITSTSSDTAKLFLEKSGFVLQDALLDYFDNGESSIKCEDRQSGMASAHPSPERTNKFTLLTWNIDGLDEEDLYLRTLSISEKINTLEPDVVFLQEVVDKTLEILKKKCKRYQIHHHAIAQYYCAIMIKDKKTTEFVFKDILPYPTTRMGRYLLQIDILYETKPLTLFTTHLESTKPSKNERIRQLEFCFRQMTNIGENAAVILGGDLNLRDEELKDIGGIPDGISDAWILSGSDPMRKFTWDMTQNDNKEFNGKWKPKCRFDRVYYRASCDGNLKISKFEFVGKERLGSCDRFPSDHWGILSEFSIDG